MIFVPPDLEGEQKYAEKVRSTMQDQHSADAWFFYRRAMPQARLRLFCFPYGGGGAAIFRNWSELMTPDIEVCPVQLMGRESRLHDQPTTNMTQLMETMAPALLPYIDRPFAFFGHCMGALISFEFARYLRHHYKLVPAHLFVSGLRAPHLAHSEPPVHHLPDVEFLEMIRHLKGTPEEVLSNAEMLQVLLPTLRADFTLSETYVYRYDEPLRCPIAAYAGAQDAKTSREDLEAWQKQTTQRLTLRFFAGDHFFLNTASRVHLVQDIIKELHRR